MSTSSNGSDADAQAAISDLKAEQVFVRSDYAMLALLFYEYFLTLGAERRHVWQSRKTLTFCLFIGLRYGSLVHRLMECFTDFLPVSSEGCSKIFFILNLSDVIAQLCLSGILVLRAFAVWGGKWWILGVTGALGIGRIVPEAWAQFTDSTPAVTGIRRTVTTCTTGDTPLFVNLKEANAVLTLLFDSLILILTITRTVQQVRAARRLGHRHGLSYVVLRDGILYFLSIEVWFVITLVAFVIFPSRWTAAVFTNIEDVLSAILGQRLILNLRQVSDELENPTHTPTADLGTIDFAHGSIIGNIGAPLWDLAEDDVGLRSQARVGVDPSRPDGRAGADGWTFDVLPMERIVSPSFRRSWVNQV